MLSLRQSLVAGFAGLLVLASSLAMAAGGYVHDLKGDVKIAVGPALSTPAQKNQAVPSDTVITTGADSHAVVKFEDGQVVALKSNSTFHIQDYHYDAANVEKSNILFSLVKGGLRAITGLIGQRNAVAFKLTAPQATIGIRGTEFLAEIVNPLYVQVVSGTISASNAAGAVTFAAGQTAVVASATVLPASIAASALPAGTFSQLVTIPVPPPTPAPAPTPGAPGAAPGAAPTGAAPGAGAGTTAGTAAGTGAAGGAATAGGIGLGTAAAIGGAVAAGVAAASGGNQTTTTHH